MSVFYATKPPLSKGAGVRWTSLRHSAEAPTEPAGETVARLCRDGGIQKLASLTRKDKCKEIRKSVF